MDTPVTGTPNLILRLEGLVVFGASIAAYEAIGGAWLVLALCLLIPDLGLLGYVAGPRVGAVTYNVVHTYLAPGALGLVAAVTGASGLWLACAIWMAHIGVDRALGLGLKFSTGFRFTHLGIVGGGAKT